MAKYIGLISGALLMILAIQSEPITATLGFLWALMHFVAVIKNWYATED